MRSASAERACGMVAVCVLALAGAAAAAPEGSDAVKEEFRAMERDIPSLYLLNGLYLTAEQSAKLAPLLQRAGAEEERTARQCERIMRGRDNDIEAQTDAFVDLAARRGGLERWKMARSSRGTRLREAREQIGEIRQRHQRDMDDLADRAYAVLSDSQRNIVDNFVPCFIPPHDFRNPERVGQAAEDNSFVEQGLERLRDALRGGARTDRAVEAALDRLTPYVMEKRHVKYSEEAEHEVRDELSVRVQSAAERVAGMTDSDFALDKAKIAAKVFSPKAGTEEERAAALRWKVRTYLLNAGIGDVVSARAAGAEAPAAGAAPRGAASSSAKASREAVDALRTGVVVGGLQLSAGQAKRLVDVVDAAIRSRDGIEEQVWRIMDDGVARYRDLRGELAAAKPSGKAENAAQRVHGGVRALLDEALPEKLLEHEKDLDRELTAAQVAFLSGFGDGQQGRGPGAELAPAERANARMMSRASRLLAEARRLPAGEFDRKAPELCRTYLEQCAMDERLGAGDIDIPAETARITAELKKARGMSQAEYAEKRRDIIADVSPRRKGEREREYGRRYLRGEPVPEVCATTRLLFTETARDMLKKIAGK